MISTRIYAPGPYQVDADLAIPDTARDHLRARRLRPGDRLILFDGHNRTAEASLERIDKRGATVRIEAVREGNAESPLAVTLVQGMGKGDAMDWVVQKATELGVAAIVPAYTDNSVVRLKGERAARKHEHWQRVAISACEQCGRNTLPRIDAPAPLSEVIGGLAGTTGVVISADATRAMSDLPEPDAASLALAVGPEGGFSGAELEQFTARGWYACHLGPRVLRMETAALAGLTVLGLRFGDLG
jgi:16S rRNA (uracil1498-N3)-methyltransferase